MKAPKKSGKNASKRIPKNLNECFVALEQILAKEELEEFVLETIL